MKILCNLIWLLICLRNFVSCEFKDNKNVKSNFDKTCNIKNSSPIKSHEILLAINSCEEENKENKYEENKENRYKENINTDEQCKNNKQNMFFEEKTLKEDRKCKLKNVQIINDEKDYLRMMNSGTLQILIFFHLDTKYNEDNEAARNLIQFLTVFDKAAQHLQSYAIYFGLVNCDAYKKLSSYCVADKIGAFAYGFQKHQEKIGFPIETLHNEDAIVASALHLSLLHSVPIIQSLTERRELEDKCRHKCDIILAFHKSLGTREHRLLLETSEKYKRRLVFALTTYSSAVYGLPTSPLLKDTLSIDPALYILHCSTPLSDLPSEQKDPCTIVSHFYGKFNYDEFNRFLTVFNLPLIVDLDAKNFESRISESTLSTPFERFNLPYMIILYDEETFERVNQLAPSLAKTLRGTIATITLNLDKTSHAALEFFKLKKVDIRTPALIFYHPNQEGQVPIFNDFDSPLKWIYEQLEIYRKFTEVVAEEDEFVTHPYYELDELQQDDEVQLKMVDENVFSDVTILKGQSELNGTLYKANRVVTVVAFYVSWDPACNLLLQHLQLASKLLQDMSSNSSLHRINCFDFPESCEYYNVGSSYPTLKMFSRKGFEITYDGLAEFKHLTSSILLLECEEFPVKINVTNHIIDPFEALSGRCVVFKHTQSITIGIFSTTEDSEIFSEAIQSLLGYKAIGIIVDEETAHKICPNKTNCIYIVKRNDAYQPRKFLSQELLNYPYELINQIRFATEPVFDRLHPDNLSVMNFDSDCDEEEHSTKKKIMFILMLPMNRDNNRGFDYVKKQVNSSVQCKDLKINVFDSMGQAAANLSNPGIIFTYINKSDRLGIDLVNSYHITNEGIHIVAVDRSSNVIIIYEGQTDKYIDFCDLLRWIQSVIDGTANPTEELPSKEYLPEFEAFNYLHFVEEDFLREAEEQLAFDMEIDIEKETLRTDGSYRIRRQNGN